MVSKIGCFPFVFHIHSLLFSTVLAPAALPGGYELPVEIKDTAPFNVTIPMGGVKNGEIFLAPAPEGYRGEELLNVPKGYWKDGLFDCFRYGVFHPSVCMPCWCRQMAMGQVMQRMRLSWTGQRTMSDKAMSTFVICAVLVICYNIYDIALGSYLMTFPDYYGNDFFDKDSYYFAAYLAKSLGGFLFTVWSIYALKKTRQNGRYLSNITMCSWGL